MCGPLRTAGDMRGPLRTAGDDLPLGIGGQNRKKGKSLLTRRLWVVQGWGRERERERDLLQEGCHLNYVSQHFPVSLRTRWGREGGEVSRHDYDSRCDCHTGGMMMNLNLGCSSRPNLPSSTCHVRTLARSRSIARSASSAFCAPQSGREGAGETQHQRGAGDKVKGRRREGRCGDRVLTLSVAWSARHRRWTSMAAKNRVPCRLSAAPYRCLRTSTYYSSIVGFFLL